MTSPRTAIVIGAGAGLLLAYLVLAVSGLDRRVPALSPSGPILPECEGALSELVMQYVPEVGDLVEAAYRQFLGQLPGDVTVHVVCPDRAAFDDIAARVGPVACKLLPVPVGHAMTTWARDRWVLLTPASADEPATILRPRAEVGAEGWPARRGDQIIAEDLARKIPGFRCRVSGLNFDGGDIMADRRHAFITPNVLKRNLQHTASTPADLLEQLRRTFKKSIVLLDIAPDHHAGMFMACAGDQRVLVGDPAWGRRLLDADAVAAALLCPPEGPDWSEPTQKLYDAVAQRCEAEGYRVVRIPVVPGLEARRVVTYVNVIIDRRRGRDVVYMPVYRNVPRLNETAAGVWRSLGFEVRPVDCTNTYTHFGSLHCLVNVLRRGPTSTAEPVRAGSPGL